MLTIRFKRKRVIGIIIAGVTSAMVCVSPGFGQPQPTYEGVPYATVGTQEMKLDIYLPTNPFAAPPWPCIINIHGGGWAGGNRYPISGVSAQLLQANFAVASVSYRLTSQEGQYGPGVSVTFPAQIHDVKGAVRWLRANAATYSLDPNRFGSFGTSAGGHLSALLATSGDDPELEGDVGGNPGFSSRVQAAGDFFGPTDILNMNPDVTTPPGSVIDHDAPNSPESHLVGWDEPGQGIGDIRKNLDNPSPPYPALVHLCNLTNPVAFVSADDPPIFVAHGTNDTLVPLMQSTRLANALAKIDQPHEYVIVPGAGHGPLGLPTTDFAVGYLRQRLRLPGDLNTNGIVDVNDLISVIGLWGPCPPGVACLGDLAPYPEGDGVVDVQDLLMVISNWSQ